MSNKPLVITSGDPAGIGPDIIIKLAQTDILQNCLVAAAPQILLARANQLQLPINLHEMTTDDDLTLRDHALNVLTIPCPQPVTAGQSDIKHAEYVFNCIDVATDLCLAQKASAMVTCPVTKASLSQTHNIFSGHTEHIAKHCHVAKPIMLMAGGQLKVALATCHIPLQQVPKKITATHLTEVIKIVQQDMVQRFGITQPHIAICGLNPHAGEQGYLGTEEQETIIPTIEQLNKKGFTLTGPLPADTLFAEVERSRYDVIVAMYHDQGLAPLKALHFESAVNITLGLPIVRTSVDHGTALSLAGTGQANSASLKAAIDWAWRLGLRKE